MARNFMLGCLLALSVLTLNLTARAIETVQAGEDTGKGTLVTKTETRTITTTESRTTNPDGSISGTFDQLIKGKGNGEKITVKGTILKIDDKETFTLDETGRTLNGVNVENAVTILRDLVGGVLIEKLTRKTKKKTGKADDIADLGGLPAFVISQDNADGSKSVKVFNNPKADPSIDAPDLVFDVPLDIPVVLSFPPLDIFVATLPPGITGPNTPPNGTTPPNPNIGLDPDVTAPTPPQVPPPLPPPPVQPPDVPPSNPNPCFVAGTQILTPYGKRDIETIRMGEYVLAVNDQTGKLEPFKVTRLIQGKRADLYKVTVNGHAMVCSQNHLFKTIARGMVKASELQSTDRLLHLNGHGVEEVSVESVPDTQPEPVNVYTIDLGETQKSCVIGDDGVVAGTTKPPPICSL